MAKVLLSLMMIDRAQIFYALEGISIKTDAGVKSSPDDLVSHNTKKWAYPYVAQNQTKTKFFLDHSIRPKSGYIRQALTNGQRVRTTRPHVQLCHKAVEAHDMPNRVIHMSVEAHDMPNRVIHIAVEAHEVPFRLRHKPPGSTHVPFRLRHKPPGSTHVPFRVICKAVEAHEVPFR
ncbi:MAG: hypothetical protein AAGJ35_12135, partial [Myxococcota bacterium]